MNNVNDFRVAFLHNKFWTHNSLLVPNQKVILNEDFVDIHSLIRIPEQVEHFKVYWFTKGVGGEICIPGQWNYAYIDGKFFHLVKMHSNGFVDGIEDEGFYYNVIYDDWQNDWMNNTFYLKGTLELTGDQELALEHLHQMDPIIENVNGFRFLNGVVKTGDGVDYQTNFKFPIVPSPAMVVRGMTTADKLNINAELKKFLEREDTKPNEDKLVLPFVYKIGHPGNGKWNIIRGFSKHLRSGLKVFDVSVVSVTDKDINFRNVLETFLGTTELYTVSSNENRVFTFAKSVNPTKWVSEIDLSQCWDITILDNLRLVPLYGVENPMPTFKIETFVDEIISRQNGPTDYKEEMVAMFEEVIVPILAPITTFDDERDRKIFRNVTLEKIDRDIIALRDPRGAIKNPEGRQWADTRLAHGKHHKNHMWDNYSRGLTFIQGFSHNNPMELEAEERNKIKINYQKFIDTAADSEFQSNYGLKRYEGVSPHNALVYLPDEYKMVAEDGDSEVLDFSKNLNELMDWFALIPDYDRKTHTLAYKVKFNYESFTDPYGLIYDPKNPIHTDRTINGEHARIQPIIFDEILKIEEHPVQLDWEKPSTEFLKKYLDLGVGVDATDDPEDRSNPNKNRAEGARLLRQGHAFMALNGNLNSEHNAYRMRIKGGKAKCNNKDYCDYEEGGSEFEDPYHSAAYCNSRRPNAQYTQSSTTKEWDWREFQTEMSFPVKTDGFSIMDILKEYEDIPDNFLRGEVINSKVKKGKIKKYMRTYGHTNKETPGCYRYGKDQEAKVPKNTVVMIGICTRETFNDDRDAPYQNRQADNQRDYEALKKYYDTTGKEVFRRLGELLSQLSYYFFLRSGEDDGKSGAIPSAIKNETALDSTGKTYPKSDGQSQLSLGWCKPHKGIGYVAWTRFYAPKIETRFKFDEKGYLNFDKKGHEDGFMSVLPDTYKKSGDYQPRFTYREPTNSISRNNLLCFLSNIFEEKGAVDPKQEDPSHLYKLRKGRNYSKDDGIKDAEYLNKRFERALYNWDTSLILEDYLFKHKTYTTNRLDNPSSIPIRGKSSNPKKPLPEISIPGGIPPSSQQSTTEKLTPAQQYVKNFVKEFSKDIEIVHNPQSVADVLKVINPYHGLGSYLKVIDKTIKQPFPSDSTQTELIQQDTKKGFFTPFNEEIPPFIIKYFNLNDIECPLHHWTKNDSIASKTDRLLLYREKLITLGKWVLQMLENGNTGIKFEGTNGYASIKLNTKGEQPSGDYELFTNESSVFKNKSTEKGNFVNHQENDVDVLINTRNELNVYGNKFPLKSRMHSTANELDVGLHITPLHDIHQTQAAVGYSVQMNHNDQDIIASFVETPKELTKYAGFSPYEKEELIRKIGLRGQEFLYNQQMLEYQKEQNKFTNQYEKDGLYKEGRYGVGRGATQILGGIGSTLAGGAGVFANIALMPVEELLPPEPMPRHMWTFPKYITASHPDFTGVFGSPQPFNAPTIYDAKYYKKRRFRTSKDFEYKQHNLYLGSRAARHAFSTMSGVQGIIEGGLQIAEAYETFNIQDEYRKQKFALAEKKLAAEGDILNKRHEFDRQNLLNDLWAMSANVVYPQLNTNIVYKLYNKIHGLNDVHIVQYYPQGKMLRYIKDYYREFGYNIMVRNFECTGIQNIVNHLRYQFIYEINYPNLSIQEMIRARALFGVKVVPWVQ